MQSRHAVRLAQTLLNTHGLHTWGIHLDHARTRCGACHYNTRRISLSRHFVALNTGAEVRATLLHEIAHALAGPGQGHGPRWQAIARRIGAPVEATNGTAQMPQPAWALRCQHCRSVVARRHRRVLNLERVRCRACGELDGRLSWERSDPL